MEYAKRESSRQLLEAYDTVDVDGGSSVLQESAFDLVLIDGKVRLACALYVMRYLTEDSVVVIHDLMPRIRSAEVLHKFGQLHMLFKYYDLIGHTRTIAAFRRKPGVLPFDGEWREYVSHYQATQY